MKELPTYVCHKTVQALKILAVEWDANRRIYLLHPVDTDYEAVLVSPEWMDKHGAKAGGYWVKYKDDYESYSPAAAFEEGYAAAEVF